MGISVKLIRLLEYTNIPTNLHKTEQPYNHKPALCLLFRKCFLSLVQLSGVDDVISALQRRYTEQRRDTTPASRMRSH